MVDTLPTGPVGVSPLIKPPSCLTPKTATDLWHVFIPSICGLRELTRLAPSLRRTRVTASPSHQLKGGPHRTPFESVREGSSKHTAVPDWCQHTECRFQGPSPGAPGGSMFLMLHVTTPRPTRRMAPFTGPLPNVCIVPAVRTWWLFLVIVFYIILAAACQVVWPEGSL